MITVNLLAIMKIRDILSYILILCFTKSASSEYKVILTSTSPVALDTPIWFTAEIVPSENNSYTFHWKDNTGFNKKIVTEGPKSNWSIIYPTSRYRDDTGRKTVTVKVYNTDAFLYFTPLAQASLNYELNYRISGNIAISQPNVTGIKPDCISNLNVTNITTILHDPFDWIKARTEMATFYYNINNKDNSNHMVVGPCLSPSVLVNITDSGRYIIEVTVILSLANHPTTTTAAPTTTTTTTTTTPPPTNKTTIAPKITTSTTPKNTSLMLNTTMHILTEDLSFRGYECGLDWVAPSSSASSMVLEETKYTFAFVSVTAAAPLSSLNITGNTWLTHGEMLRLNINCTGTGPFGYCFNITHGIFNESDPKICTHQRVDSNVCDFKVHYYLPRNGTYSLVIAMDNDVSSRVERHALHVYNTDKEKQLTYIIVPMTCTIIAILMIMFGIARYIQNKKRYSIEVADFDFGASDEQVYKPFLQQLRDAISSSCSANLEDRRRKRRYIERPEILEDDD